MIKKLWSVLAALTLLAGGLLAASPAQAAEPPYRITDGDYTCFGKTGRFKPGTRVLLADWNQNGKKEMCVGVAPDRTIWYIQPTSADWKQVPGGGRADDMIHWWTASGAKRVISVWVANPRAHYYTWWNSSGWAEYWWHCPTNVC
ncbi:hypothetical protein AB0F81_27960 [Actinoplanes sp. NPDC024001]|uniref:hypothetical protein n=1 Tax=Actinoplanes sp. NPDC024001 TaxID=3154598 RepID=UPI0033DF9D0F